MEKHGPVDFGKCICHDCEWMLKPECPRVDAEAGVLSLDYHSARAGEGETVGFYENMIELLREGEIEEVIGELECVIRKAPPSTDKEG